MPWIITVGAGKGGVGKSLISASIAYFFARQRQESLLVDLDLGGCNLHSWLGISPFSQRTLSNLFTERRKATELVVSLNPSGLYFLQGPTQYLQAPNLKYAQKQKLIQNLKRLPYQRIIADLGAGSHYHVVDFFLLGDVGILVVTPERTSIENAYRFLKVALLRLLFFPNSDEYSSHAYLEWTHRLARARVSDLLRAPPYDYTWFRQRTVGIRIALIVNQVLEEGEEKLGSQVAYAIEQNLLLPAIYLGALPFIPDIRRFLKEPSPPLPRLFELSHYTDSISRIGERLASLLSQKVEENETPFQTHERSL